MTTPAATTRVLLERLVDYAGLFPPASLSMAEAVADYASYRASPDAWMLGRLVVPIARLDELAACAASLVDARDGPWTLSGIAGPEPASDFACVRAFNGAQRGRLVVDSVELRAASASAIESAMAPRDRELIVFVEIPLGDDPRPLLEVVKRHGARAKARTGGTTASSFPTAAALARFIVACAAIDLPFKVTAGLHHALRAEQRLTYDIDAPLATMFGFLNVFLAAAFARAGMEEPTLSLLLEERESAAFTFGDDAIAWRDWRLGREQIADMRHSLALGFGSCSFREPVDELHDLALL
jgi:hypothetical protein